MFTLLIGGVFSILEREGGGWRKEVLCRTEFINFKMAVKIAVSSLQ